MNSFTISLHPEYNFAWSLNFLKRSPKELLHRVEEDGVFKVIEIQNKKVLFKVQAIEQQQLHVTVLNGSLVGTEKVHLELFIREWLDIDTDLKPFYSMAKKDKLLQPLVKKYFGYRIIGQPDLFESLVWAVLGQQINVSFAYTLKHRFVEQFGECISFSGQDYFLFPKPAIVALLTDEDLLPLQFSRQKSKYTIQIAQAFVSGHVSKEKLEGLSLIEAKEKLMALKGVGNWTANYALMKTFRHRDAFPLEDAGVHNAIKNLKGMKAKPTLDQVKRIFKKYKGWEAYATLYLWKSL